MDKMTREEVIQVLKEIPSHIGIDCDGYELRAIRTAIEALSQPEIIHCAECKYFTNLNDDEFALCDRAFTGMYVDADGSGFCKWAERRTDA